MKLKTVLATALAALLVTGASGCASPAPTPAVDVVTTTNVWADITQTIGGENLTVQAILTNPNQDPHSYEASARDELLVSKAKLVIAACNSSDAFIKQLVKTETNLLCLDTRADSTANPHIWYNLGLTYGAAQDIRTALAKIKPSDEANYTANFETFSAGLKKLGDSIANPGTVISEAIKNRTFTAVESVANDLFFEMGLTDVTPESVQQAGLNETDLSPVELRDLQKATAKAGLFSYNSSQLSAQSKTMLAWLKSDDKLPYSVGFSEQLPEGLDYLPWMQYNVNSAYSALTGIVID